MREMFCGKAAGASERKERTGHSNERVRRGQATVSEAGEDRRGQATALSESGEDRRGQATALIESGEDRPQ